MKQRDMSSAASQPTNEPGPDTTDNDGQLITRYPAETRSTIRALARRPSTPDEHEHAACSRLALAQTTLTVTHDMNNILMVMGALLEPAPDNIIPAGLDDSRGSMQRMVKQLAVLCHHLQLMARSHGVDEAEDVTVLPLAKDMVAALLAHTNIQVSLLGDESLSVRISRVVLMQILQNLLLNAHQAMQAGGELFISVTAMDLKGNPRVALIVADQGCGIRPEILPRIFEMRFTTRQNGQGIGLAFVKAAVEQLGGEITARSTIGKGSVFTLFFPLAPQNDATGV